MSRISCSDDIYGSHFYSDTISPLAFTAAVLGDSQPLGFCSKPVRNVCEPSVSDKVIGRVVFGSFMFSRGKELELWNEMVANQRESVTSWLSLT